MNQENIKVFGALILLLCASIVPQKVRAAYNATPNVPGLSGGSYKPLSVPALTGSNFSATGKVLINGKLVPIPGYIPPASTAAQAAKISLWANPWLIGAALLTWSSDAGLNSDMVTWRKTTDPLPYAPWNEPSWNPTSPDGIVALYARRSNDTCPSNGYQELMTYCINGYASQDCGTSPCICCAIYPEHYDGATLVPTQPVGVYTKAPVDAATFPSGYQDVKNGCPPGYSGGKAGVDCQLTDPEAATPEPVPATQADFEALPAPPVQALAELAPQVGVPVDSPVYEPGDVSIGSPYTRPDGSTAEPRAKISPAPDGQVTIDTYDKPLTDPIGTPIENPTPQDTQEQVPSETQCDKYPATLGCANLDTPTAENLGTENRSIALIAPVPIGSAGSCPAPLTASFLGQAVEMSFEPLCQFATSLQPLVLALAWLAAGVIFIGGVRNA